MAKKKRQGFGRRSPEMERVSQAHMDALQSVLAEFQFLEEALRRYIEYAFDIIRVRTAGSMPFNRDRTELEGLALGRLIDEFSKYADEPKLVGDLKGLVQDRNRCAHVAFMEALIKAKHHSENSVEFAMTIEKLDKVYMRTRAATGEVIGLMTRLGELCEKLHRRHVIAARRRLAAMRKRAAARGTTQ